ncbi:MAG TPA: hypothetical protein VME18_04430 [Acidobacteriaceae bacterium]|nr:hypothetical protein [Acidobacteriaceae bacterium]
MPHAAPNSDNSPDPGQTPLLQTSEPMGEISPLAEMRSSEPQRVVAYLRSEIKATLQPRPKSETRFFSFLHRKRRTKSVGGVGITPAAKSPVLVDELDEPGSVPTVFPPAAEPVAEEDHAEPFQAVLREAPGSEWVQEEESLDPTAASQFTSAKSYQISDVEAAQPATAPENSAIEEGAADEASEPILEPALESSAEPELLEAAAQLPSFRGEVLPPDMFDPEFSGSAGQPRAAEPARVITMQPATPEPEREAPPTWPS